MKTLAPGFSDEDGKEEKDEKHSPAFFTLIPQREGERRIWETSYIITNDNNTRALGIDI